MLRAHSRASESSCRWLPQSVGEAEFAPRFRLIAASALSYTPGLRIPLIAGGEAAYA
jgi:hypothetical protein